MIQHLQFWDYTSVSGSREGRYIEFVDQPHGFVVPAVVVAAAYKAPSAPGYNTELSSICLEKFLYPSGKEWEKMFRENVYVRP